MQPILTPDPDAKMHPDEDYDKTESLIELKKGKRIDNSRNKEKKQKNAVTQIIVIAAVLICIVVIGFFVFTRPVPVKEITGIEDVITLEVGQMVQVTPQVEPKRAAGVNLIFSSENPSIVSVDLFGVLHAMNSGVSRITIDAKGFTKVFTVIVSGAPSKMNEEWRNEGYEEIPPFREYERMYHDGFPTDIIRYTGKIKPEDEATTDFAATEEDTTTAQTTTEATVVTTIVESTTSETTISETITTETATETTFDAETTTQTTEAAATATTTSRATSSQITETRPATTTTTTARQTTRTTTQRTTTRARTTSPVSTAPTTEVRPPQTETIRQPETTQQEITVPRRDRGNKPPDLENEFIER